jgi:prephenate dehydratase
MGDEEGAGAERPARFAVPGLRVAFQGELGANSEEATRRIFLQPEVVPLRILPHVFGAVVAGDVDYAAVPVENSQAGSINQTYDLLLQHHDRLVVLAEYDLRVRHCLLVLPGQTLADIRTVYSHPQALDQCAQFLDKHSLVPVAEYDTAGSAMLIRQRELRGCAAIASRRAAEIYDLQILAQDIQTNPNNYTKFLVVGPRAAEAGAGPADAVGGRKTSLVFAVHNTPGALWSALGVLARRSINMTKLESRPSRNLPWGYVFYADVEGDATLPSMVAALDELRAQTRMLEVLGSYPIIGERAGA